MMTDLEAELERLSSALDDKGAELRGVIKEEKQRKEAELQVKKHLCFLCFINSFLPIF